MRSDGAMNRSRWVSGSFLATIVRLMSIYVSRKPNIAVVVWACETLSLGRTGPPQWL
jgi:hypothetical protein